MASNSASLLINKLGYLPKERVMLAYPPDWLQDLLEQAGIKPVKTLPAEWTHGFFYSRNVLEHFLASVPLEDIGKGLWVSWPKKTSGITTDLTDQVLRNLILPHGWVDTKVAAIDSTWSGLKFMRRKA